VKIVVIGAGFGGLAAAIRLRARGHDVELVEKRSQAGGRAGVFRQDGSPSTPDRRSSPRRSCWTNFFSWPAAAWMISSGWCR
jgi:glycine/D-amino acid oxidase-like deaminating enzyme